MEEKDIIYADPAGNITAMVRGGVTDRNLRHQISCKILEDGRAEQVGFLMTPINGGDCRLEMMGGEFCGNATRACGYLWLMEHRKTGEEAFESTDESNIRDEDTELTDESDIRDEDTELTDKSDVHDKNADLSDDSIVHVEISGAPAPVEVHVHLRAGEAYADMPVPFGFTMTEVDGRSYPVVHMEGIDHMIVEKEEFSDREAFTAKALKAMGADVNDASGIMFLQEGHLTPVVYVRDTDSLVWESSCGSGSVAAAWYLTGEKLAAACAPSSISPGKKDSCSENIREKDIFPSADGNVCTYTFTEPGGTLTVRVTCEGTSVTQCFMGGSIRFLTD